MPRKIKTRAKEILGQESYRNLTVTLVCDTCKGEYHPRKNGYEYLSKYCSRPCTMIGLRKGKPGCVVQG
jgi:hypothetical protein